ncbi:MAG: Ig domain-containing protein, partial [Actinomycetota bacterium]|nr:Ig domain-containing protein [Actinomycetota bacterium]
MLKRFLWGGAAAAIGVLGLIAPAAHAQVTGQSGRLPGVRMINLRAAYQRALPTARSGKPSGIVYPRGHRPRSAAPVANRCPSGTGTEPNCKLTYGGGKVQTSPQIYLLLWGPKWTTNAELGSAAYLQSFYRGIGVQPSDSWSTITSQYTGSNGEPVFGTSTQFKGTFDDTSTPPHGATQNQLAAEANAFARQHGLVGDLNAQIVIATQEGTCPQGFYAPNCDGGNGTYCAWHTNATNTGVTFTNLPYLLQSGFGCGKNFVNSGSAGIYDGLSVVGGHEYAETITDPVPVTGWFDSADNISGGEIGDKCAWGGTGWGGNKKTDPYGDVTLSTGKFAMQSLWSNAANRCVMKALAPDTVTLTNPGSQSAQTGDAFSATIQATSSTGATLGYSATGLPPGLTIDNATGTISGTPLMVTDSAVTVTAGDTTGAMRSTTFRLTVTAGQDTVYVVNPGYQTNQANQKVNLQIRAYSSAGHTLTYQATNLPPGVTINGSTGLISGRLQMLATTFGKEVTVTATDTAGSTYSATFYWTVSPVTGLLHGYRNECASDYLYRSAPGTPAVIRTCNTMLREHWT